MLATGVSLGLAVLAGDHLPGSRWRCFCLAGFTSQAYLPAFWTLPTDAAGEVGRGHGRRVDLPGQSGRIRRPVLFGYLQDRHRAITIRACGSSPGACCWRGRSPHRFACQRKQEN